MSVGSSVSVTYHCHPFPDPFVDKKVLVNISEKVQFHVRHFKSSLPGQSRGSVKSEKV